MGATNLTPNYELSQFIGTDKPAWLQDYNGDMLKIDTGIAGAKTAADNAQSAADGAQGDATTALSDIANINTELGTVENTLSTATGNINTINSLIGNGTPTTTDQTIIGAINEINAGLNGSGGVADQVDALKTCATLVHSRVYSGSPDGVKTIAELGKEAGDALLAIVNDAQYTGKKLLIDGVFIGGIGTFIFPMYTINLTGSLTGFATQGELATIDTNKLTTRTWYFGGTGNITMKKVEIDGNGVTSSYEGATVATSGITIDYRIVEG